MFSTKYPSIERSVLVAKDTLLVEYSSDIPAGSSDIAEIKALILNKKSPIAFSKEIFDNYNFGKKYCYFSHNDDIIFMLPDSYVKTAVGASRFFLSCEMSCWGEANKDEKWALDNITINDHQIIGLKINKSLLQTPFQFKFISSEGVWYSPTDSTPNEQVSSIGTTNFLFVPNKTGDNILQYNIQGNILPHHKITAEFSDRSVYEVDFSQFIETLYYGVQLGSITNDCSTTFKIFAPRATNARVAIFNKRNMCPEYHYLSPSSNGVWHIEIQKCLHKYYYYYQLLFNNSENWGEAPIILDPYAKATVSSTGPGIILHDKCFLKMKDSFVTPDAKDLTILELHIRDVLKNTQVSISKNNRLNFCGLTKYLKKQVCYIKKLGVNCVELQPIHEFDYTNKNDYHWGYMPANWFSPSSAYASNPEKATQVKEFKKLVKRFHKAGIAVIVDVVYNHFGDSGHLQNIDTNYYFRHNKNNTLSNFSGCGNDFRTESVMAQKLILDSLEHMVKTYNVDGFRFDLAELLGMEFLNILQKKLKNIKSSIILFAEPWSFRNNIGIAMNSLPYSVWNDEYREFIKSYVLGDGNSEGLKYFLCGGLDFRSKFPSQSVNYVASHDDRGWVDNITENPHNNGSAPTKNDRRRTHLSAAILMMSIGIPMITEGQDFMHSKRGASNTYNRGDLNALDYNLLKKHADTHKYFRKLIKLRKSKLGEILRLSSTPSKTFFRFFDSTSKNSACALMYNADDTFKAKKLIFAINPCLEPAKIDFKDLDLSRCKILANEEKVFAFSKKIADKIDNNKLELPPLSCRILILK